MSQAPPGWEEVAFEDVFEPVSDKGRRLAQSEYQPAGAFPVVDQGAEFVGGYTDDASLVYDGPLPVFAFGDHTRRVKLVKSPFVVGAQGVKLISPRACLEPAFAAYSLGQARIPDRGYSRHFQFLKKTRLLVPPLAEQRRIVSAIDEHLSRLDAADTALAVAFGRSEAMRRSALKAALGSISTTRCLAEVAETQLGKMLSERSRTGVGSRPYLRNKNVRWGRVDLDDLLEMDFSERDSEKFSLRPGDVLVCEGGEVGRAAVWHGALAGCCYQKALHRVRVGDALLPDFLAHVLRWMADGNAFDRFVTGSTIKHLPQEDLRMLPIPCPSVDEQRRIVGRVEEQLSVIDALRAAIERAQRRSASLRRAVLERAFRGDLVPQDPSDEPASVLLERIADERTTSPAPPQQARAGR
jgi:hypothetical protein